MTIRRMVGTQDDQSFSRAIRVSATKSDLADQLDSLEMQIDTAL